MRVLAVACGNTLRRDDGVAHYVLELLAAEGGTEKVAVLQFVPELSETMAGFDVVFFLDADAVGSEPRLETVGDRAPTALTHKSDAAAVVQLSRRLFGFRGEAWVCRIPAQDFGYGEGLSALARDSAGRAAAMIAAKMNGFEDPFL